MKTNFDVIKIYTHGATITTGAASARIAIPVDDSGVAAKRVYVAATVAAYVLPGSSSVDAAAGDLLLVPGDHQVLDVAGMTHIAAIQVAAAGVVSVTPVEF